MQWVRIGVRLWLLRGKSPVARSEFQPSTFVAHFSSFRINSVKLNTGKLESANRSAARNCEQGSDVLL
jgi:hypothetical protein